MNSSVAISAFESPRATCASRAALLSTKRKALTRAGIDPASPTLDL